MIVTNATNFPPTANPLFALNYEAALESLGEDYYDRVPAAAFPQHILRFRNDQLLPTLGADPQQVSDEHFIEAFGKFEGPQPCLALRYHGYQFGEYNPFLGDGRGFLYGQVRGTDGELYDFGTKGSGTTPYSRGGDGRLTLKGGVREVLAAEALHALGVRTSRCLSLVEAGESLWRGDEPSPTRSSVMVRMSRSHIRFGTFERLHAIKRPDLIPPLLEHVIHYYYPHLKQHPDRDVQFYRELVQRVADLVAQWMSVGFCHAVLNTDNMPITGESFDYGPYAFMDKFALHFTAAYFDYFGRYSYANQPSACQWNLEMLQIPLASVIPQSEMKSVLEQYSEYYWNAYCQRMLHKLGFEYLPEATARELLNLTLDFLKDTKVGYHDFFMDLAQTFSPTWRETPNNMPGRPTFLESDEQIDYLEMWRKLYHKILTTLPAEEMEPIAQRLRQHNPTHVLIRPRIEAVWERITEADDWQPFYDLVAQIRAPFQYT